jgi:hypothetical protein
MLNFIICWADFCHFLDFPFPESTFLSVHGGKFKGHHIFIEFVRVARVRIRNLVPLLIR